MFQDAGETCRICGGDGRIGNAMGDTKTCPACHGSGRRAEDTGWRDVTKTKPSHYKNTPGATKADGAAKSGSVPRSPEGLKLAAEVRDSTSISGEEKEKLTREIAAYEASHGHCTKTFSKKIRKQLRPASA
jgi:DnaJ-class molecular chaperone